MRPGKEKEEPQEGLFLLTTSTDRTACLWAMDQLLAMYACILDPRFS